MRDGAQQRRLDEIAAPQRLGLERLALEPVAVDGDGEQRGERRQEAPAHGDVRVGALRRVERADRAAGDLERSEGALAGGGRRGAPSSIVADSTPSTAAARRAISLELLLELAPAQELGRELGEQGRLALALLRRGRAPPRRAPRAR